MTAHNGHIIAAMTYSASTSTTFSNLIGINKINLTGKASAESAQPVFVAIYALVDASGSMGIGASTADQDVMQRRMHCTVACHINGSQNTAHALGAKLRFDVVQAAMSSIINASGKKAVMANQFSFAVSKFSNDVTEVSPLSSDTTKVAKAVQDMELDDYKTGPGQGMGTNFAQSINNFAKRLPAGGDGSSPDKPLVYVLIMTDGVSDNVYEVPGTWVPDPNWDWFAPVFTVESRYKLAGFNPALCDQFKKKGMNVMTLDMEYVIPANPEPRYVLIRDSLKPAIRSNLQKCATQASFAYLANSPADIENAIDNMFESAIKSAHLSS